MPSFRPHLSAAHVHEALRDSLVELRTAERNAVLWFSEVLERKLYCDLGCSSIQQYAELRLGFSASKTAQFVRLAKSMKELPALKRSVASGQVPWTKARAVVRVATPKTERAWIREARTSSRRELETKVSTARVRARESATAATATPALDLLPPADPTPVPAREVPVDVRLRLLPDDLARLESLLEALRKAGESGSREELLLAALDLAVEAKKGASGDLGSRPTHQVIVHRCPDCERGSVTTSGGEAPIHPERLQAILCDAQILEPGKRNRSAVPPALRRRVLARDRHRCRGSGCRRSRFLQVHHLTPREGAGPNLLENLITLCSGCHRTAHAIQEKRRTATLQNPAAPGCNRPNEDRMDLRRHHREEKQTDLVAGPAESVIATAP